MCIKTLGFAREGRSAEVYFCVPTPGLGVAIWWSTHSEKYFCDPFELPSEVIEIPAVEECWVHSSASPICKCLYADDDLHALSIVHHFINEFNRLAQLGKSQ